MLDEIKIVLRGFDPIADGPCVYACWRNSWFYDKNEGDYYIGPARKMFKDKTRDIKLILDKAMVRIACLQDSPSTIIGFSVFTDTHLDWIYVKVDYRKKGIGTLLCPKNIQTVTKELTKIGRAIAKKKNLIIQGETNVKKDG